MNFKAVAKSKKTGNNEWYTSVYTDGEIVLMDAPSRRSIMPLKEPVELWAQLNPDSEIYTLIWERRNKK